MSEGQSIVALVRFRQKLEIAARTARTEERTSMFLAIQATQGLRAETLEEVLRWLDEAERKRPEA